MGGPEEDMMQKGGREARREWLGVGREGGYRGIQFYIVGEYLEAK